MLPIGSTTARRPAERLRINYAHPLARKLRTAIVFGANGAYDAISGKPLQTTAAFGSPFYGPTPYGVGLRTPNGAGATIVLGEDWSGPCTVVYRCWINSVDSPWGGLWSKVNGSNTSQLQIGRSSTSDDWYIQRDGVNVTTLTSSSVSGDLNTLGVFAVANTTNDGSAAPLYYYKNGVLVQQGTQSAVAQTAGAGNLRLGCEASAQASFDSDVWWYEFLRFDSVLSADEIAYIGKDTRRLFARRRLGATFEEVAGGGSWSVSLTETASASDSLGAATTALVSLIESASAADIITAATIAAVALTEAASASDTQTASYSATGSGSVTESASASDALTAANTMLRALTETASADEQLAAATTMLRAISESASASDDASASYTAAGAAAITETASATDALTAAATLLVTILEAGSATDALAAATTMVRAITEQATAADTVDGALPGSWTVSIEELAAATDAIAAFVAGDLDALARYTIIGRARAFEIRGRQRRNEVPK